MSVLSVEVTREQILEIVQEVFAAMLDQGEFLTFEHLGDLPNFVKPLSAWVDMEADTEFGHLKARAMVRTEEATANEISRLLLMLDPADIVTEEDLIDAFGEIANVVGGNVKALINAPAKLSMPQVFSTEKVVENALFVQDLNVSWRGNVLTVSLWLFV